MRRDWLLFKKRGIFFLVYVQAAMDYVSLLLENEN